MPNDEAQSIINTIGAIAEMEALHFKELIKHGFTRKEALELTQTYLMCVLTQAKNNNTAPPE